MEARRSMALRRSLSQLRRQAASTECLPGRTRGRLINSDEAEARLKREIAFDPDLWIVEVENGVDGAWLDLAP